MADKYEDDVSGIPVVLPVISEWTAFTPIIVGLVSNPTRGTNTEKAYWRRVGSTMEIQYAMDQTGAGSAGSGAYSMAIPTGLSADTTVLVNSTGAERNRVGNGYIYDGTNEWVTDVVVTTSYSSTINAISFNIFGTISTTSPWGSAKASLANTTVRAAFFARIPIAEWAGSANVAYGAGLVTGSKPGLRNFETPQTALTVTGTNWTTVRAVGIAYADNNGIWRLKFTIEGTVSSGVTSFSGTISGTTFKTGFAQTLAAQGLGTAPYLASGVVGGGNGQWNIYTNTSCTTLRVAGDLELDSKPSWA